MKTFIKWLLLVLLFAAAASLVAYIIYLYSVPSDDEDTEFMVTYNGSEYVVGDEEYLAVLPSDGQALFSVSGTDSYTVNITCSYVASFGSLDFYYTINGGTYLPMVDDYTDEFVMDIGSDSFIITCTSGYYDYETLLMRKWNVSEVVMVGNVPEYPYKMVITSADGNEITILLKQA